ncbi:trigger factor [Clostridium vincentii]|uniref:Trigger factor n=1 Tax=Clostridium vincentii TaxID=52704 RepID=A0A2T0BEQ7_9CLOT|nr:trigger factor [Clostridium vincentii]PRR82313.1 Trigger factor [Clostridium vincentii]
MEAKMEKIEVNLVKIEVRVEAEKFSEALKKSYNKNKSNYTVQGFRNGKVPMSMVKKFYGIEVLFEDAINFAIDDTYAKVLDENNIKPVDYPNINVVEVGEGKDLVYTAEITIFPEVKLGEYKKLDVKKPVYDVKDEDIEKELKAMQEKNSRVETKTEGTVENGNIAIIDFKGSVDGVLFEGGEGTDFSLEIGSGSFIGNFEEQLVGAAVGEKREVKVTFPENYGKEELNGKEASFEVTVNVIKVKELPELDDEFSKEVSEFDTLEEVKADIKKKMEENNEKKAISEFENAVIAAAVEASEIELPQIMIEKEINGMVSDLENRLKQQGLTLDQYMEFTGSSTEKMRDYMKSNAEAKVKADLVLEEISKAEKIETTEEEVKEKALELAKMYSASEHEKMAEMLLKSQKPMIEKDIIIEKTIKVLTNNVK